MQSSLEQAVQLEEGRLSAVALRSKCRKLESESLFADVFEKYEEEIRQLQVSHPMHPPVCVLHNNSLPQPCCAQTDVSTEFRRRKYSMCVSLYMS